MMKRAFVTGASSGIGYAIAEGLLKHGMSVIGLARSPDRFPAGVTPVTCDLRNPSQVQRAFNSLGEIDILVNSAGLALNASIMTGDPENWQAMWQVNVHALTLCSQLALSHFPQSGGHILNISSMSGHRVPPSGGFYASTKFAVRAISEALRAELKSAKNPTRVSSISPGFVDTPILDQYFIAREDQLAEVKAAQCMLTPESVAATALHILTSPDDVEIGDVLLRSSRQAI